MTDLKIASVQFENATGDKARNLATIRHFAQQAAAQNCHVVAFHECCIPSYTFARRLSKAQLLDIAEPVPDGQSVQTLIQIARENNITILAGLFERDDQDRIYNTYVCVNGEQGLLARFRKLHPFISTHLSAGDSYVTFDLRGWKCGILICYDNNVVENVRATALLGAQIIFMPHVTMCTPSPRPGAGFVDSALWARRETDPTSLRAEFDGLKGRKWLMKWLPARAYDNGVYVVFSNPVGVDDDQVKNGCAMVLDPFGDVVDECRVLGDGMAVAVCTREKLERAGGHRYRMARRPELYKEILGREIKSRQSVSWIAGDEK